MHTQETLPSVAPAAAPAGGTDGVAHLYETVTELLTAHYGPNLHMGYWAGAQDDTSLADATDRLTDEVIGRLGVSAGQRVLDVGCGTGASALRLAAARQVAVWGVTISHRQVLLATSAARRLDGPAGAARFAHADAMALPCADGRFDAAYAIESLCHMHPREAPLREVARVLRPGGRLVIADGFLRERPGPEQLRVLEEMGASASMHTPPLLDDYRALLAGAGLRLVESTDVTEHTRPSQPLLTAAVRAAWRELPAEAQSLLALDRFTAAFTAAAALPELAYLLLVAERH